MNNNGKSKKVNINVKKAVIGASVISGAIIAGVVVSETSKKDLALNSKIIADAKLSSASPDAFEADLLTRFESDLNSVMLGIGMAPLQTPVNLSGTNIDWLKQSTQIVLPATEGYFHIDSITPHKKGSKDAIDDDTKDVTLDFNITINHNDPNPSNITTSTFTKSYDFSFPKTANEAYLDDNATADKFTIDVDQVKANWSYVALASHWTVDSTLTHDGVTVADMSALVLPTSTTTQPRWTLSFNLPVNKGKAVKLVHKEFQMANKVDKQAEINAAVGKLSGFTLSGNKVNAKLQASDVAGLTKANDDIKDFAHFEYTTDNQTWTPIDMAQISSGGINLTNIFTDSAKALKVRVAQLDPQDPTSTIQDEQNVSFAFANGGNASDAVDVSSSSLANVIDVKDFVAALAANTALTISGDSKSPTFASSGVPAGVVLSLKDKSGQYVNVSAATGSGIYGSTNNLWNNTNNSFDSSLVNYQISASTSGVLVYDSSQNTNPAATLDGTTTPATDSLTKCIDAPAIVASGFTVGGDSKDRFSITVPATALPNNLKLEYSIINSSNNKLAFGDKATIEGWVHQNNLWQNNAWAAAKITVKYVIDTSSTTSGPFSLAGNTDTEIWNSSNASFSKTVDTSSVDLTSAITFTGDSDNLTFTNTLATDRGYSVIFSNDNWKTSKTPAELTTYLQTTNLWNNSTNNWKADIKAKLISSDSTKYSLSSNQEATVWAGGASTAKVVDTTDISGTATGNTKTIVLPNITVPNNTHLEFEVFNLSNQGVSGAKGNAAAVQAWVAANNLWDSTNRTFAYSAIKARIIADSGYVVKHDRTTSVWDKSANTLARYTETSTTITSGVTIAGNSKNISITEPSIPTDAGYVFKYSVDGTTWFSKADFESKINGENLWKDNVNDTSKTSGEWRYNDIKVQLEAADTTFTLSSAAQNTLWTSSNTNMVKFVDASTLKQEVLTNLKANGTLDNNLKWEHASIDALATKLNLKVQFYLLSESATTPNVVPTSGWADLAQIPNAWPVTGTAAAKRHVWIKIVPASADYAIDTTTYGPFEDTSTGVAGMGRHYQIKTGDFTKVTLNEANSSSLSLSLTEPNRDEFSYKYSIDGGITKVTLAELNALFTKAPYSTSEGIWNSVTQSWRINSIRIYLVAKDDYTLDGTDYQEAWTKANDNEWNGVRFAHDLTKYIDTSTVIGDLTRDIKVGTGSFDNALIWTDANTKLGNITNRKIKVQFLSSTTVLADKGQSTTTGWLNTLPTAVNEDQSKRFLYARISPENSWDVITTANPVSGTYVDLSTSSGITSVLTKIDTSNFTIDQDLLAGDSHNLTGATTFNPANQATLSAYKKLGFTIIYTLTNWQDDVNSTLANKLGYKGTIKKEMSEAELKAIFAGASTSGPNLYDLATGSMAANIKAKFVANTKYALSDAKEVTFDYDAAFANGFKKYVDTQPFRTKITTTNKVAPNATSLNNSVTWTVPTLTTLGYSDAVLKLQFATGNFATAASIQASDWSDSIATSIDYTHANRHLWVKLVQKPNFVFSSNDPVDLTSVSGIQGVVSSVDSETNYSAWDASKIAFTGNTKTPTIDETLAGTLPVGSKIQYQVKYYDLTNPQSPVWKDSGWKDKNDFVTFIQSNRIQIRTIQAHLAPSDATKYKVAADKAHLTTTSNFYSYVDDSALISTNFNTTLIHAHGNVGKADGVQIVIPQALGAGSLAQQGLVLQMNNNGGGWVNFDGAKNDQIDDAVNGFVAAQKGLYKILTVNDNGGPVNGVAKTTLKFRIIPNKRDDLITNTTVTDQNDWKAISDNLLVTTSDIVANNQPTEFIWDMSTLPKLVQTSSAWITANNNALGGNSRALNISSAIGSSAVAAEIANQNAGATADYSSIIGLGFNVSDSENGKPGLPSSIFFTRENFITWLSGAATTNMDVYDATQNKMVKVAQAWLKPNWNSINMTSFSARWYSNDSHYTVSDAATVPFITKDKVQKWTDLTAYLDALKNATIQGDTAHLTSGALTAVASDLTNKFGSGVFKIQSTAKVTNNTPDWTTTTPNDNALPDEINFNYDLGFRIIPIDSNNYVASTEANNSETNLSVVWAKASQGNIDKFIHVHGDNLSHTQITGDTRNFNWSLAPEYLKADATGTLGANGTYEGLDIYAWFDGVSGYDTPMQIDSFKAKVAQQLSIFDGTWGKEKLRVAYRPKTGYKIDVTEEKTNVSPTTTGVKRYIDISSVVNSTKTGLKIITKNAAEGWWNDADSSYSLKTPWSGYVDNHDFDLAAITVNTNLKIKIQYSTDGTSFSDTKPTTLNDDSTQRQLWFKYVADGDYSTNETAELSDTNGYDVTTASMVKDVKTRVDLANVDLTKVKISGDTRRITEDFSAAKVPANTHLEYSLTGFINPNTTNTAEKTKVTAALAAMGIDPTKFSAFKSSMTIDELKALIIQLSPQDIEIKRDSLSVRVVPENGYSITQPQDTSSRKPVDTSALYTLKDITDLTAVLKLASTTGGTDGINLYGQKGIKDGILVQIPDDLVSKLTNRDLKLQFTISGAADTSGQATIAASPTWNDVTLTSYAPGKVSGSPDVANGFLTTLQSINGVTGGQSFIGFRIVPSKNDRGVATTAAAGVSLNDQYEATKTKLFTSTGALPNKQYTLQADFYSVDTSKVPVVISVDGILAKHYIKALENTKFANIEGDDTAHNEIDAHNNDKNLDDNLQLLYSIDLKDGSFINGQSTNPEALWLTKQDMLSYLKGDLVIKAGKVVNKNDNSQVVEAFDAATLAKRHLDNAADNTSVAPNYIAIDTIDTSAQKQNSFFVKWVSTNSDYVANPAYIPSEIQPVPLDYTPQTFRKWFDGGHFNTAISQLIISGTTENQSSWNIDFDATPATKDLKEPVLTALKLKLQYSYDGQTWQDNKLDWNTTWANRDARAVHLRVVPLASTSTVAIGDHVQEDGIYIDYTQDKKAGNTANTTSKNSNNVSLFRTFLNVNKDVLANVAITGNSFELAPATLDESVISPVSEDYTKIKVEYLFNGVWYSKQDLIAEMERIKNSVTDVASAQAYVAPTDFTHAQVQARLRVIDVNNYVANAEKTVKEANVEKHVSENHDINVSGFKTFVNVWKYQAFAQQLFNLALNANPDPHATTDDEKQKDLQGKIIKISSATSGAGDQLKYLLNASIDGTAFQTELGKFLTDNNLKIQWSVTAAPINDIANNTVWFDSSAAFPVIVKDGPLPVTAGANQTPPLWFRFAPIDAASTVVSSTDQNGLGTTINPIKIDTSNITYEIKTSDAELTKIVVGGDTQNGFVSNETPYISANGSTVQGIDIYITDANGNKIANPTTKEIDDWLKDMGVRINYQVEATRTKGSYVKGTRYEFATKALFQTALNSHELNFDRSSLKVRWDFSNTKFTASEHGWVTPDVSKMTNIVYTEDTYSLTQDSLFVTGNNLKTQAPTPSQTEMDPTTKNAASVVLVETYLKTLGMKIQYNWKASSQDATKPDANEWKDEAPDGSAGKKIDDQKHYWIRFAAVDDKNPDNSAKYQISSDKFTQNPGQVTAINVNDIKQAISFTHDTVSDVLADIAQASVQGTTYDFSWDHALPIPNAFWANGGKIQYSHDNNRWSDTIADMLSDTDYYQNGILQLDKDRNDKLYIRYVYSNITGNQTPIDSSDYVYTDKVGNEIQLAQLTKAIDITNLQQPIFTSATFGKLTGQSSITVAGLVTPDGAGTDFAGVKWTDFANSGMFKPNFGPGNTDIVANFKYMWYDGQLGANNNYILNLAQNPFNPLDKEQKTDLTALTPRHTHFEYRWSAGPSSQPNAWTDVSPVDVAKNSNYNGFEVRLVPDAGYILKDTSSQNGAIKVEGTYLDKSAVANPTTISSQEWTHTYKVVVELLTKDVHLPSAAVDQAKYIGWNDAANSTGTFFTDGANGDHTPSNDPNMLKNISVKVLDGTQNPLDFINADKGYVLEWNVQDGAGKDIVWKDTRGEAFSGWHPAVQNAKDKNLSDVAPGSTITWYGAYPTSLKNGDVVQVRLRARDGFIITKDDKSTDYNALSKESRWSHTMTLAPVSSLTNRIDLPKGFGFYDVEHPSDLSGRPINVDSAMPVIKFDGNEGNGTLAITGGPSGVHYSYEVAVLRPVNNPGGSAMDNAQKPFGGYCLETLSEQIKNNGTQTKVYDPKTGWVTGYKKILEDNNAWQQPANVKDLSVGDAIIVRLVADSGFGFEWEDQSTSFVDSYFPKANTFDLFGTNVNAATVTEDNLGTNAGQLNPDNASLAPIPARGLKALPRYTLDQLKLVYSTDPAKNLNNGASEITLNLFPGMIDESTLLPIGAEDKYRWTYTNVKNNITNTFNGLPIVGLKNGDQIIIKAQPINSGYELDPSYNNSGVTLTVSGLSMPLSADGIAKPELVITGYDGKGTISSITPSQANSQWETYDPVTDVANYQAYPLGRPMSPTETTAGNLIWQYQVVKDNPADWSASRLAAEPWTNDIPKNLAKGDFVRMRVGTVDNTKVALANNGKEWVYSLNPNPIAAKKDPSGQANTWFEVKNLFIDTTQLDYGMDVTGFIQKTSLSLNTIINSDESSHVKIQFRVDHGNTSLQNNISDWVELGKPEASILGKLSNNDTIEWRAVALNGYTFNANDANVHNGMDYIEHTQKPDPSNSGQTIDVTNTVKVDTYQSPNWKYTISGLKIYINTDSVSYDPDKNVPGFDINSIIVDSDGNSLDLIKHPIDDGSARIVQIQAVNTASITDVDGHTETTVPGTTTPVPIASLVKVRYIVKSVDPFTGEQQPEYIINGESGDVPKNLSNGDEITVELHSTNPDYELSSVKTWTIKISGLTTNVDTPVTDPLLTFSGESGQGSIAINPIAPKRTKWVYATVHEPQPGQSLPVISEVKDPNNHTLHPIDPDDKWIQANPNTYYWTSTPPVDLVNGDYSIAMLVASVSGSGGLKANNITPGREGMVPINTEWVKVQGLAQKIDLSRYSFKMIDEEDPWNPNQDNGYNAQSGSDYKAPNYAFKYVGRQEGQTELQANAILQTDDPTQLSKLLIDSFNRPMATSIASVVQWAFAVTNSPDSEAITSWSTTLPKTLFNNQYVHVKLVGKQGLNNIEVFGYKPQVFKVEGLDAQASIASKAVTLVAAIVGGTVALGGAVGTLLFIRKRKKKLHFMD